MMSIPEAIAIALQSYQTGNLSQAELTCQQILQQQPNNTDALQLLGVMAHQIGKLQEAIFYYQQLIALRPDQAETYYYLGAALDQQGQLEQAIVYYQQALALKPDYTDVHYDLANAFKQQGNLSAAIKHYQQSLSLNPNDAEVHGNLANALLEQGQFEAAITHYHQVIALKPHVPGVYYNLGNAYRQQGQIDTAITNYRWALVLDPSYMDACLQLAASLHSSGQQEEAIFYYQQAIFLNPNSCDAYYKLGNILVEVDRQAEAIASYQKALALEPHMLSAYFGLGRALINQFQFEEASACFQQALTFHPDHPEAYYNLAVALANQNKLDEAISSFQKALQLNPDFVEAYWHNQLILPVVYETQEQIQFWRQRFCRKLKDLIQQTALNTSVGKKQALRGFLKSPTIFYLNYQGLNDRGVQRKYGKFVHQVIAANYPQWASSLPMPALSNAGKIRVGYISAHLREHSVAKTTLGWLKNCDREKFEIYSYHIDNRTDFITQEFRSCSDSFHHIYGSLDAVCEKVIADKLHILVFTDIGMVPRTTQIAGLRLAPVQCTTWGHPVTSGFPTIDYFLSSDLMEPEQAQSNYSEKLVRLPNIGVCYEKPLVPQLTKNRSSFQLREDAVVYLCCQSLFKYLPQFDFIFAQIAQHVPQAQFVFISSHSTAITAQVKVRLKHSFAELGLNSEDYCVFVPGLERVDFFNLNLVSDIFLDTFSWSGCNTTLEAIACGLPVVTCPGEFMRSRHSYAILKMMGITETIATDEAEYIEIAVRLALEPDWRQQIVQKIYERQSWLYDDKTCVAALESFYQQVVQEQLRTKTEMV
jgi:predicted O-linked N-acetylglucosamine transferase (SPINDLY family)